MPPSKGYTLAGLFAFLIFLSTQLPAQNNDPRIKQEVQPGVKSVQLTVTRIFTLTVKTYDTVGPPGINIPVTHREKRTIYDTTVREARQYDQQGNLASSQRVSWDSTATTYHYTSDSAWSATAAVYRNGYDSAFRRIPWQYIFQADTVAVKGNTALAKHRTDWYTGILVYVGDSCLATHIYNEGRAGSPRGYHRSRSDSFWDYESAGPFARKVITHSFRTDTVKYLNAKRQCLIKVINHFDSTGRVDSSEYYNYQVKKFAVQEMYMTPKENKTYYLQMNRSGKPSCTVFRTYNEKGLLTEERLVTNDRHNYMVVKRYEYQYY
ncbi:MAG TPA: hypothetical protein VK826_02645 [Bacteroidia bacterium]|nr:hypothetical protein [Bacteroidia bacterium]